MFRSTRSGKALVTFALVLAAACTTAPKQPEPGTPVPTVTVAPPQTVRPVSHEWRLLPAPRQMEISGEIETFVLAKSEETVAPERFVALFQQAVDGFPTFLEYVLPVQNPLPPVTARIAPSDVPQPQGYELVVGPGKPGLQPMGIHVKAHDEAGLFYAIQTLKQLSEQAQKNGVVPVCHIVDWPDFPNRGVMLDVARNKVPTMETLYEIVDMLASWKYNQLQLYTEHTFAYPGHEVVWKDASPMTAEDVQNLDAYCKERFVQLIPNQNSFGHMNRWLSHPEYADLAETPNGSDLCPVDPRSIELLRSMYTALLPNFSSPYFNVGCDETWSLGKGRSKAACAQKGEGRVYLDFLMQIHDLVTANGKQMQFWADIINNHPELIPELPKDVTAMEWGYDAGHPYPEHTKRFRDNGVRFYVVPGTSSWNSLLGRTDNMLANLRESAQNGRDNGGEGYLITDWGDGGHWQFLPVSFLPYAYGAGLSWCLDTSRDLDPARVASEFAFRDEAGVMGKLAYDLGNAHLQTGVRIGNNTIYYLLLQHGVEKPLSEGPAKNVTAEIFDKTAAYIDGLAAQLDNAKMDRPDADLIKAEYRMNAAMATFACHLGAARMRAGGVKTSALPKAARTQLAAELEPLIPAYRELWLARNREGGLQESAGGLENLLAILRS